MAGDKTIDLFIIDQFSYLESLSARGIRTDLSAMREALSLLDHPEKRVPVVLVGGTNGKGSVVAMTGGIMSHAGYRVGRYFSPHVREVRERIVLGKEMIGRGEMAALIGRVRGMIEERIRLTYFEFLTIAAYVLFAEEEVDLAVMEVGMGGRFDATNVAFPVVSAVTTVSLDHTQYLGETLEEIAGEKAQIVRSGGTLVAGRVSNGVRRILKRHAKKMGARAFFLGEDFSVSVDGSGDVGGGYRFSYRGMKGKLRDLGAGLVGAHQADNGAVSLAIVELLTEGGYRVPEEAIRVGVASAHLSGRMEKISDNPETIADVAHNPAGARALADFLATLPKRRTAFVVGIMKDKDIAGFLREVEGTAEAIYLASPRVARAASPTDLSRAAAGLSVAVRPCKSVGAAISAARDLVGRDGRVVVTGSFYMVGEAMEEAGGPDTDK